MSVQERAATIFAGLTFRLVLLGLVLILSFNTYADFYIKGPFGLTLHYEGWKAKAQRLQLTIDQFANAQIEARKKAEAAIRAKESEYRDKARKADDEHELTLARVDSATDRYIAAHRVCEADRGSASTTPASAPDNGPGISPPVPADAFVAVGERDVRAVGDLYAYALTCRSFVLDIGD